MNQHSQSQECSPISQASPRPTHCHWIIWAFKSRDGDQFTGVVQLDVLAADYSEALGKAQDRYSMSPGIGYDLRQVIEHFDSDCH